MKQAVRRSARNNHHSSRSAKKEYNNIDQSASLRRSEQPATVGQGIQDTNTSVLTSSITEIQDDTFGTPSPNHAFISLREAAEQIRATGNSLSLSSISTSTGLSECTADSGIRTRRRNLPLLSPFKSKKSDSRHASGPVTYVSGSQKLNFGSDDETLMLLIGSSEKASWFLQRSMKLAYCHHYSKANKEVFRHNIRGSIFQTMTELLLLMNDLQIPLHYHSNESHAMTIMSKTQDSRNWLHMPLDVGTALAELWKDPGVLEIFHRTDRFGKHDNSE